jgi:membrane-bound lytic murein transglycosylase D
MFPRLAALLLPVLILAGCATPTLPSSPLAAASAPAAGASTASAPAAAEPALAAASAAADAASAPGEAASDVATAPVPVDPLQPDVRVDLDDRSAQNDLWERVRRGFAIPDLENERVHERERWYADRPDYVQRMTERGSRYLFHIVEELERRNMPTELALLPFIESAFNPQAVSTAKAAGMWQFIPSTGRDFLLTQNVFRDERRDILASTRAALDYLQKLYGMFGDWQLALAAYNWGEGSVQRAIAHNQKRGLPTDYDSLNMPNETRYYVPKLQAVKNIVSHPENFGLALPPLANHPYFLSVPIEHDIDVDLAVRLAGMPLEEFKYFNPQMNRPVILAAGSAQVLLPYDNANLFVRGLMAHHGPLATWTAWVAPKTMRTATAAQMVGMSEADLRAVNQIPARMLVKAGSTLVVPRPKSTTADVSDHLAENAVIAFAPEVVPPRKLALKAGRHDSVATVARRYHVSSAQVAQWNGVSAGAAFKPGQTIVVYVPARNHARPVHAASKRRPQAPRSAVAATARKSAPTQVSRAKAPVKKSLHVANN